MIALLLYFAATIQTQPLSANITINQPIPLYNGSPNSLFIFRDDNFDCTAYLYSYSQPLSVYQNNSPIPINIMTSTQLQLNVSTMMGHFTPTLDAYVCDPPTCIINLKHNCPITLEDQNYFDVVQLQIQGLPLFSYNLNCESGYNPVYFEWGQLILTITATTTLILSTLFAKLEAFMTGLNYNLKWVLSVAIIMLIIGTIALFAPSPAAILMDIIGWVVGTICCSIVALQLLFVFLKHSFLREEHHLGWLQIRNIDLVSTMVGVGVVLGWWLSSKNWLISDLISLCIIITGIKVLKFVSLKIALISYLTMLVVVILGAILPYLKYQQDSPTFFMALNSPLQLQVPTITPTYGVACSWISVTSVIFPGLLVAYLHRFDKSRSTNIYILSTSFAFFLGGILWDCVSALSYYPIPFDCVSQPFMMTALSFMACQRKELRTIWEGTFYDQQFLHKKQIQMLGKSLQVETPHSDKLQSLIPPDCYIDHAPQPQIHNNML